MENKRDTDELVSSNVCFSDSRLCWQTPASERHLLLLANGARSKANDGGERRMLCSPSQLFRRRFPRDLRLGLVGVWILFMPAVLVLPAYRNSSELARWLTTLLSIGFWAGHVCAMLCSSHQWAVSSSKTAGTTGQLAPWKAFVYQRGFIESQMQEAYVWTWLAVLQAVFFICLAFGSLFFRLGASQIRGSWVYMYFLPLYTLLTPAAMPWGAVHSSEAFKKAAAAAGYPGTAHLDEGAKSRVALAVAHAALHPAAHLSMTLLGLDHHSLRTVEAILYYVTCGSFVVFGLVYSLPRVVSLVKHRTEFQRHSGSLPDQHRFSISSCSLDSQSSGMQGDHQLLHDATWGKKWRAASSSITSAISSRLFKLTPSSRGVVPEIKRRYSAPLATLTSAEDHNTSLEEDMQGNPEEESSLPWQVDTGCPVEFDIDARVTGDGQPGTEARPSEGLRDLLVSQAIPTTAAAAAAEEDPTACLHPLPTTGWGAPALATSTFPVCSALLRPLISVIETDCTVSTTAPTYSQQGPKPLLPASDIESGKEPQSAAHRSSAEAVSSCPAAGHLAKISYGWIGRIRKTKVAVAIRRRSLVPGAHMQPGNAHVERRRATITEHFITRRDTASCEQFHSSQLSYASGHGLMTLAKRKASVLMDIAVADLRREFAPVSSFRKRLGRPQKFVRSIGAIPGAVGSLVANIPKAVAIFAKEWRMFLARAPHKTLLALSTLLCSPFSWGAVHLKITESYVGLAMHSVSLLMALFLFAISCGWLLRADQAMVISGAGKDQSIGSGLVFSVKELLEALTYGRPLPAGFLATEDRLMQSAAISCRWDAQASWTLMVKDTNGKLQPCKIHVPRQQLHDAAAVALQEGASYLWMDTISIPQLLNDTTADPVEIGRKLTALQRLVSTMTGVYGSARLVLVVETALGLTDGTNAYSSRAWTLQECVMNPNTTVVRLDGTVLKLGPAPTRGEWTGLKAGSELLTSGLDDLDEYGWLTAGMEHEIAQEVPLDTIRYFPRFANSRSAFTSGDKAIALGQLYFRLFFPDGQVCQSFMQELAAILALSTSGIRTKIIDNQGWDASRMTGSADPRRFLTGRPCEQEKGETSEWDIICPVSVAERIRAGNEGTARNSERQGLAANGQDSMANSSHCEQWLCMVRYTAFGTAHCVPAKVYAGPPVWRSTSNHGAGPARVLYRLQTLLREEFDLLHSVPLTEEVRVSWV